MTLKEKATVKNLTNVNGNRDSKGFRTFENWRGL